MKTVQYSETHWSHWGAVHDPLPPHAFRYKSPVYVGMNRDGVCTVCVCVYYYYLLHIFVTQVIVTWELHCVDIEQ